MLLFINWKMNIVLFEAIACLSLGVRHGGTDRLEMSLAMSGLLGGNVGLNTVAQNWSSTSIFSLDIRACVFVYFYRATCGPKGHGSGPAAD